MKTLYKTFFLICFLGSTGFLKMDTLSEYNVPPSAQSICAGDLNLDGFNDIIVGNSFNYTSNFGGISILRNQGWAYFAFTDTVYAYANEWSVATAQLDTIPNKEILFSKYDPILDLD